MFRVLFLGLLLATSAAHAQGISSHTQSQPRVIHSQSKPDPETQPNQLISIQKQIERIARALETANAKKPSSTEVKNVADARDAQKDMAASARNMFYVGLFEDFITAAGVILVFCTLVYTRAAAIAAREAVTEAKLTTTAANRQADAAEGALTKLERPHLFIEAPRLDGRTHMRLHPNLPTAWIGGPPGFDAEYDVFNYGRSPAILKERSATIFIGDALPDIPDVNPNDVFTDPVAVPSEGSRKGWCAFYRGALTDEIIANLRLGRSDLNGGGAKAFLFVRLRYDSVYGKTDEIGVIWEYLIDIDKFVPRNIPNYTYRIFGG